MKNKKRQQTVLTLYSCSRLFHFLMIFDSGNGTWSSRSTTLMKVQDEHKERNRKEKKRKWMYISIHVYMNENKKLQFPLNSTNVLCWLCMCVWICFQKNKAPCVRHERNKIPKLMNTMISFYCLAELMSDHLRSTTRIWTFEAFLNFGLWLRVCRVWALFCFVHSIAFVSNFLAVGFWWHFCREGIGGWESWCEWNEVA